MGCGISKKDQVIDSHPGAETKQPLMKQVTNTPAIATTAVPPQTDVQDVELKAGNDSGGGGASQPIALQTRAEEVAAAPSQPAVPMQQQDLQKTGSKGNVMVDSNIAAAKGSQQSLQNKQETINQNNAKQASRTSLAAKEQASNIPDRGFMVSASSLSPDEKLLLITGHSIPRRDQKNVGATSNAQGAQGSQTIAQEYELQNQEQESESKLMIHTTKDQVAKSHASLFQALERKKKESMLSQERTSQTFPDASSAPQQAMSGSQQQLLNQAGTNDTQQQTLAKGSQHSLAKPLELEYPDTFNIDDVVSPSEVTAEGVQGVEKASSRPVSGRNLSHTRILQGSQASMRQLQQTSEAPAAQPPAAQTGSTMSLKRNSVQQQQVQAAEKTASKASLLQTVEKLPSQNFASDSPQQQNVQAGDQITQQGSQQRLMETEARKSQTSLQQQASRASIPQSNQFSKEQLYHQAAPTEQLATAQDQVMESRKSQASLQQQHLSHASLPQRQSQNQLAQHPVSNEQTLMSMPGQEHWQASHHSLQAQKEQLASQHSLQVQREQQASHHSLQVQKEQQASHHSLQAQQEIQASHHSIANQQEIQASHHSVALQQEKQASHHSIANQQASHHSIPLQQEQSHTSLQAQQSYQSMPKPQNEEKRASQHSISMLGQTEPLPAIQPSAEKMASRHSLQAQPAVAQVESTSLPQTISHQSLQQQVTQGTIPMEQRGSQTVLAQNLSQHPSRYSLQAQPTQGSMHANLEQQGTNAQALSHQSFAKKPSEPIMQEHVMRSQSGLANAAGIPQPDTTGNQQQNEALNEGSNGNLKSEQWKQKLEEAKHSEMAHINAQTTTEFD